MRIRNASRTEADQLNAITMQAKAHWGYTAVQLEQWRESLSTDPQSIERWPTFVAEDQGIAIGFTQINPELAVWELVSLFVLPAHTGRGVGRALLKEAVAIANQAGQTTLHIDSDPNAEPFYLACGAVRIGSELAPIQGDSARVRPQLHLSTSAASPFDHADPLRQAAQPRAGTLLNVMKVPKLSPISQQSERIVQAQLDAYNARDLEAWLETYSEDAQQYLLHTGELATGRDAIRKRMEERFRDPELHANLIHRITMENIVVDHELVARTFPDGLGLVEMVCIYEVSHDKIVKATFAIGQARPG